MLTTLEANFIQEYKMNGGNAKEAVVKAGYKAKYPSALGSQLLKKPKIARLINRLQERTDAILTQPCVSPVYMPAKTFILPTREEYAQKAWERSSDESKLKDDTKHKYFETAGKALGHISRDNDSASTGDNLTIICRELRLSLSSPPPNTDLIINQNDLTNNQESLSPPESSTA